MPENGYLRAIRGHKWFSCDLRLGAYPTLEYESRRCFDGLCHQLSSVGKGPLPRSQKKRSAPPVSCEDCFFRRNTLCALDLPEPCATFRPHEAQLRPPQQLRFVFRQERRSRSAWAFPTAEEQAALHA
jgi:hypothetical protein